MLITYGFNAQRPGGPSNPSALQRLEYSHILINIEIDTKKKLSILIDGQFLKLTPLLQAEFDDVYECNQIEHEVQNDQENQIIAFHFIHLFFNATIQSILIKIISCHFQRKYVKKEEYP